jgi:hypothetical protein
VSGKDIVSTLQGRKNSTMPKPASSAAQENGSKPGDGAGEPVKDQAPISSVELEGGESRAVLEKLKRLSYVDAILWLGSRLADGLAHAHERGIVHRDLKPENILLTDEGQPMLLDFNLSEDIKPGAAASGARIGGTIPYMAPEHLEAIKGEPRRIDACSDIYSLGLILFELLTGRQPFAHVPGSIHKVLPAMIEERKKNLPGLRAWSNAISPAVEAIVQHCLQPDPARRYQSADDLREDLERQLADLPLKHAPEPSVMERLRKWARRHPRLTSSTSMAMVAGLLLVALSLDYVSRQERLAKLEALERRHGFVEDARTARLLLNKLEPDRKDLEEGGRLCDRALRRYRITEDPSWTDLPDFRLLPAGEQEQLREDAGEMLLTSARALLLHTQHEKDQHKRQEQAGLGLRLNMLARPTGPADRRPRPCGCSGPS